MKEMEAALISWLLLEGLVEWICGDWLVIWLPGTVGTGFWGGEGKSNMAAA